MANRKNILLGSLLWGIGVMLYIANPSLLAQVKLLFFFGVSIVTPLTLGLVQDTHYGATYYRNLMRIQPIVVLLTGISLVLERGVLSQGLALGWLGFTAGLAAYGVLRLVTRPVWLIEEICIDGGLIYSGISGFWFMGYQISTNFMNFDPLTVLLTATHFCFISLGMLIIAGMTGRTLTRWRKFYRVVAFNLLISPMGVAMGITLSNELGVVSILEPLSALFLGTNLLLLSGLILAEGRLHFTKPLARNNVLLSASSVWVTMVLAIGYPMGRYFELWQWDYAMMTTWHGTLNALGFVGLGLMGWTMEAPRSRRKSLTAPFSRLRGGWHVGATFFARHNLIDPAKPPMHGIVDDMNTYSQPEFDPTHLTPEMRRFYEYTHDHALLVFPQWHPRFRGWASIYKRFSGRIEQMNFPLSPDSGEMQVQSVLVPLRDDLDGREQVRGWLRTYQPTGKAVYCAAYSSHVTAHERYMNIAFPLLIGNMTSILRLRIRRDATRAILVLSSFSDLTGDQGVYFAIRGVPIRLPINEIIEVYPQILASDDFPENPDWRSAGQVFASHRMWIFGMHFLTLYYAIYAKPN